MGNVFLLGCEEHYLRALIGTGGDDDVCSQPHRSLEEEDPLDSQAPDISLRASGHFGRNDSANVHVNGEENAGTLVIHIRSGDIFKPEKEGWHGMIWYGQVRYSMVGTFGRCWPFDTERAVLHSVSVFNGTTEPLRHPNLVQ